MPKQKIILITTGGTIEKIYDEFRGTLENRIAIIKGKIEEKLRLPYTEIDVYPILAKDSLTMTRENREYILEKIKEFSKLLKPIVILHGTDTLDLTFKYCVDNFVPVVPIVFTGSMRPTEFSNSDAMQNIAEALIVSKILPPDIYVVFHGEVFKNRQINYLKIVNFRNRVNFITENLAEIILNRKEDD